MFCISCGLHNPAENAFCWRCGRPMPAAVAASAGTATAAPPTAELRDAAATDVSARPALTGPDQPAAIAFETTAPATSADTLATVAVAATPTALVTDTGAPAAEPTPTVDAEPTAPTGPSAPASVADGWPRRWRLAAAAAGLFLAASLGLGTYAVRSWTHNFGASSDFNSLVNAFRPNIGFDSDKGGFLDPASRGARTLGVPEIARAASAFTVMVRSKEAVGTGFGSGVVVRADGYILTNKHVVQDATSLKISLPDGKTYDAVLKWQSKQHDLALIKADIDKLTPAPLGDSGRVSLGEQVVAVGYPLGSSLGSRPTITSGIVSQVQRMDGETFIQTDAAINPGNSGGPLLNLRGEGIGINTLRAEQRGGRPITGISWAIPIDIARTVLPDESHFLGR